MSDTLAPVGTATDVPKDKGPGAGRTVVRYLVRFVLLLVFALPLLFMLVSSLKPDAQIFGDLSSINAFLPVGDISLANYTAVFERVPFWRFMMNSIILSALTVGLGLLVNSMCAFA